MKMTNTITEQALVDAFAMLTPPDNGAAAALLALPMSAAPGIDFGFTGDSVTFRGVTVRRSVDVFRNAMDLHTATFDSSDVYRDLSDVDEPLGWVGEYRSGSRWYSAGMWPLFGLPEVSVPADRRKLCAELCADVFFNPAVPLVYAGRSTRRPLGDDLVVVDVPVDPGVGFLFVPDKVAPTESVPDLWGVLDEVASEVATLFGVEVNVVPSGSSDSEVHGDVVASIAGWDVSVPVVATSKAVQVGVPAGSVVRTPSIVDVPEGFVTVGAFGDGSRSLVATHTESGFAVKLTRQL